MARASRAKLPRSLWILFAGIFVNRFGSFVTVFLILYMISRGYTLTQRLPMGPVIAIGFLLIGLGFGLITFASTFPLLTLTVGIWTFGEMIHSPISAAYVANLAPPHLRGRYQGTWGMIWSGGLILGPLLGTLIFSWSTQGLWLICGGLGMVSALLIVRATRKEARESATLRK